jgi:cytochrome c553
MRRAMKTTLLAASLLVALAAPAHAASGDAEAGKRKAEPCKACHGATGISISPDFPNLAGQHADYLAATLRHYQDGKRSNAIMKGMAANLSKKDILDLAAWFSTQQGLVVKY